MEAVQSKKRKSTYYTFLFLLLFHFNFYVALGFVNFCYFVLVQDNVQLCFFALSDKKLKGFTENGSHACLKENVESDASLEFES